MAIWVSTPDWSTGTFDGTAVNSSGQLVVAPGQMSGSWTSGVVDFSAYVTSWSVTLNATGSVSFLTRSGPTPTPDSSWTDWIDGLSDTPQEYGQIKVQLSDSVTPNIYNQAILDDTPVAFWPLSDSSGTTASDISGNNHNGTITGGVELNQPGPENTFQAMSFNGSSGVITTSLTVGAGPFSAEAWFLVPSGLSLGYPRLMANSNVNIYFNGFQVGVNQRGTDVFFCLGNGSAMTEVDSAAFTTGAWNHVVGTYDGTTMRLYLNGTLAASATVAAVAATGGVLIGAGQPNGGYFDGSIGEAAVYNYALSASTVTAHYDLMVDRAWESTVTTLEWLGVSTLETRTTSNIFDSLIRQNLGLGINIGSEGVPCLQITPPAGTTPALLTVQNERLSLVASGSGVSFDLSSETLGGLVNLLQTNLPGWSVTLLPPPEGFAVSSLSGLSASVLEDVLNQDLSQNSTVKMYTSVLWLILKPVSQALSQLGSAVLSIPDEAYVTRAEGRWLDRWGDYLGAPRYQGEPDPLYRNRLILLRFTPRTPLALQSQFGFQTVTTSPANVQIIYPAAYQNYPTFQYTSEEVGDTYSQLIPVGFTVTINVVAQTLSDTLSMSDSPSGTVENSSLFTYDAGPPWAYDIMGEWN